MLDISEQQLRGWQRQGFISASENFSFSDLIALRALQNNNDIEVSRDDIRFAETQLRALYGFYDPVFSVTPQIIHNITPQQSSLGGGGASGTTTTTIFNFSPSLTKTFEATGGNYTVSFANSRTTSSSLFSTLSPFYSSNLSLTYNQPLWRNRPIDANRRSIRIQKKFIEQSDSDFRARTIQIISQVQAAYWNLVFALRNQQGVVQQYRGLILDVSGLRQSQTELQRERDFSSKILSQLRNIFKRSTSFSKHGHCPRSLVPAALGCRQTRGVFSMILVVSFIV